jgi:predicted nucleic acid-binding Zn ribbon protein
VGSGSAAPRRAAVPAAALGTVFSKWEELVGPAVAKHTRPLRVESGTLVVAVDQPPWATQVRVLAPHILARVSERTGEPFERLDVVVRSLR